MSAKLEKLSFSISLLDRVSKPVAKIQRQLGGLADKARSSFANIAAGGLGVLGSGMGIQQLVQPALDFNRAMGEVASLGVAEDVLKGLGKEAIRFSNRYGVASTDFVRSSYDIQSAISGLAGNELATFTSASNLLAKATKANAATITDYMGTMYGIFQQSADKMGKAKWVEMMAGQTATAVNMFKTDGNKISAAFTALGANATAAGIAAEEQMAVLGKLSLTLQGGAAGTQYKAFLAGVGKAQKKLGLSFVDSQGNMLGMLDILGKIKGKFGDKLSVESQDLIQQAFGSSEAGSLINSLMKDTQGLADSIDALGKVKGMDAASMMAGTMVDSFQRFSAAVTNTRIAFGNVLLPILNPIVDKFSRGLAVVMKWTDRFPNLARLIGHVALGLLGLTAVLGLMAMAGGIVAMVFSPVLLVAAGVVAALAGVVIYWGKLKALFQNTAWGQSILQLFDFILLPVRVVIFLIGLLITHWDALKNAFMDTNFGKGFVMLLENIGELLGIIWNSAASLLNIFTSSLDWWSKATSMIPGFANSDPSEGAPSSSPSLDASRRSSVAPGGVTQHISNTMASSRNNQRTVGQVVINTDQPMTKSAMDELLFMGA